PRSISASTEHSAAPLRIRSVVARPPSRSDSASTRIDFPAPVSPDRTWRPRVSSSSMRSTIARFSIDSAARNGSLGMAFELTRVTRRRRGGRARFSFGASFALVPRPRVVLFHPRVTRPELHRVPWAVLAVAGNLDRDRYDVVLIDGGKEPDAIGAVVEA